MEPIIYLSQYIDTSMISQRAKRLAGGHFGSVAQKKCLR
jgi:hypothetical protein